MNNLALQTQHIPAMNSMAIEKVSQLEGLTVRHPQIDIATSHLIHAGMYARTIMIPANTLLTGALIKVATVLIVCGDVIVYLGDETREMSGYNVLAASANRKQAFVAKTDTFLTMIFCSKAASVKEAEGEFTDDAARLMSRSERARNDTTITGE